MTLEIYSPITKTDSNYGLGENITTSINQLAIIPILSDSIYKDPLSAIRELYSNEITSCRLSKLKTRIEIKVNTENRELILQGFNSMGITREVFDKILTVMGNSGNSSGKLSGKFGLGFFAHVKLSEKMIVHSYSQDEKRLSFISKSGLSFEILPDEFCEKLENYGTKIILNIKDSIDLDKLILKLQQIIELAIIETKLIVNGSDLLIQQFRSLKEKMNSDFNLKFQKKYSTQSFKIYENSNEFYDIIIIKKYPITYEHTEKCYLLNVPITFDIHKIFKEKSIYEDFNYYLNVKDEDLFLPHVSRDYFTNETEIKLIDMITKDMEIFKKYDPHVQGKIDLKEYLEDPNRFFNYRLPHEDIKTRNIKKSERMEKQLIAILESLPDNYIINGVCLMNSYNTKILNHLYDFGYIGLSYKLHKYYQHDFLDNFKNISDVSKVLLKNGLKNRFGIKHIKYKVFSRSILKKITYIFKIKDPEFQELSKFRDLGFTSLESKNKNHLDIKEILNLLGKKTFYTNTGYKKLSELKNYNIYFTTFFSEKLIPNNKKFCVYVTDQLDAQLIALYHGMEYYTVNLIDEYLSKYKFKNENLKFLIENSVINVHHVYNLQVVESLLNLDNSFNMLDENKNDN